MRRIITGAGPLSVSAQFLDDTDTLDVGTVTVSIIDLRLTEQADPITATKTTVEDETTYSFDLPSQPDPTILTLLWEAEGDGPKLHTVIDVVTNRLFAPFELRAHNLDLANTPINVIESVLSEVEDFFAQVCAVSFIRRFDEAIFSGDGDRMLWLPRSHVTEIAYVIENDVDVTADVDFSKAGVLRRLSGARWSSAAYDNVRVGFVNGHTTVPQPVARVARVLATAMIAGSDTLDRAMVVTDDTGTYRLAQPDDRRHPTGIPEVDAVIGRYTVSWGVA